MKTSQFLKLLTIKEKVFFMIGLSLEKSLQEWKLYQNLKTKKRFIFDVNQCEIGYRENEHLITLSHGKGAILLRRGSSDIEVFKQVYIGKEYDPVISFLLRNEIEVTTIIDLGSNIGLSARKFLDYFNPSKIICLEPDMENYNVLCKNLSKFHSTAILLQKAIWSIKETLYIDFSFRDGKEWARGVGTEDKGVAVEGISMKNIIADHNLVTIDLLKIDVEGTEAVILNPLNDLTFLNIVKVIAIEIHDEFKCRDMIYEVLKNHNFIFFDTGELTIGIKRNK